MKRPHADLDLATHAVWQQAAEPLLRTLFEDPSLRLLRKLDTKVQSIRRFPDAAALVRGQRGVFIAHTEFETDPRPARLPQRMHTYGNLLYALMQGRFPVCSTVVVLGGHRRLPNSHRVRFDGVVRSYYRYRVWRLNEMPAARLAADPALAALAPLAEDASEADLVAAARNVRAQWSVADAAELLGALYITGSRAYGMELVRKVISLEEIEMSPGYLEILNRGMEKGIERGLERGLEQGLEQGLERGLEQARSQHLARLRTLLARQISQRFPDAGPVEGLLAPFDLDELEAIGEALLRSDSLTALLSVARDPAKR